ncbi:MAG: electron transport protein SCO1/SenC [Rhodobacter sp.]|nr:electron transport protein SCO1/SenC [Rhodobacter sp.]
MRLSHLQIILWVAAAAAAIAFAALRWSSATDGKAVAGPAFTPSFTLADSEGRVRTTAEFRGKFLLVFFGFTSCPDVCPTTLSEVAQIMDDLGSDAALVQPIFISIDPDRDRQLGLAEYTTAFHPSILGLAGSEADTRSAAASFKIFYGRETDSSAPDGYTMAHSPGLFLIDPNGEWLRQFGFGTPAAEILSDLQSRF